MRQNTSQYSVIELCEFVGISRSGYYEWHQREESERCRSNRKLMVEIKSSYKASRCTYGAIRVSKDLKSNNVICSKNRVARLMRSIGLKSVHRTKYKPQTTQSDHSEQISPNVVNQDFTALKPNQKWGCDITYIPTREGFVYLAVVLDFYSRKIVGYKMGTQLHAELCCEALRKAGLLRSPPEDLIHHSDRGVQYASIAYRKILKELKLIQSMSRTGNCYDNAMVESFFHTLKVELVHQNEYQTREECIRDVEGYITGFYNNTRLHSSLGYLSPVDFESINKIAA